MKIFSKAIVAAYGMIASSALFAQGAFQTNGAKSLGDIGGNVASSFAGASVAVEAFAYIAALVFVIIGILKFKAHRDDPRSNPLGTAVAMWLCAALFAFSPMVIGTAGVTIWGANATSVKMPSR